LISRNQAVAANMTEITIDLSRVPGLTENLQACADLDLRTPEAQALVILRKSLGLQP
jgi:hypothetical protein